jgi:hypothetical protein
VYIHIDCTCCCASSPTEITGVYFKNLCALPPPVYYKLRRHQSLTLQSVSRRKIHTHSLSAALASGNLKDGAERWKKGWLPGMKKGELGFLCNTFSFHRNENCSLTRRHKWKAKNVRRVLDFLAEVENLKAHPCLMCCERVRCRHDFKDGFPGKKNTLKSWTNYIQLA